MSLYSTYWYRVADLKPRLGGHVRLFRHNYRGEDWYVLQDPSSSRQHRFNKSAYTVIGLLNGKKSVQEVWDSVTTLMGDDAPTQDEVIRLLGQLHRADVLQSNIPADTLELFDRQEKHRSKWKRQFTNPFALRMPLFDPDRFLAKWSNVARVFMNPVVLCIWLIVVGTATVLAAVHWPELTLNISDRILKPENLLILWLVYPVIKLLHELGHAFATRVRGGEVHEMGIMLLAFTPIPYVEASASAAFPDKRQRMGVAAAGMAVELFIASLALLLWLNIESGQVSAIAYNVMLVGGFSTLLFNGNPLLRFDGYYILSDYLEIPNLAQRSSKYLGYLLQRYLFGIADSVSPVSAPGERAWFIGYGVAAFCYRLFILAVLALFISTKFYFVGVLIALWAGCTQIIFPILKNCYLFYHSTGGRRKRARFFAVSLVSLLLLSVLLFVLPVPLRTQVEGVVRPPEHSVVRAGTDCLVTEIIPQPYSTVKKGDSLIRCVDPFLEAEVRVLEANLMEVEARYVAEPLRSRVQREILKEEVVAAKADLARSRERLNELLIRSPNSGSFILPDSSNLVGHYVKQGTILGYVTGEEELTVIVVVGQADISLVRERTGRVEVRLVGEFDKRIPASSIREIPAASDHLPSRVLGTTGGGAIQVDPTDEQGVLTLVNNFNFELILEGRNNNIRIGERAYARFDHGYEPLGTQLFRALRGLFLHKFHV